MNAMTLHTCNLGRVAIAAALLSWSATATPAAQATGAIEGAVVNANGSPLPGVVVTVTGPGVRQEHVTGADGAYMAAGLAAGDYVVTAVLPGFETAEIPVSVRAPRKPSRCDARLGGDSIAAPTCSPARTSCPHGEAYAFTGVPLLDDLYTIFSS